MVLVHADDDSSPSCARRFVAIAVGFGVKVTICRRRYFTDDVDTDLSGKDPVAKLGSRVERARAMLPLQADPALAQALSFGEIVVSFGVEAMVSILQIMDQATTAARIGQRVGRAKIIAFEVPLLVATVGLNAGPHTQAGDALGVVLYSAAPVMVVIDLWLHTWPATRYARMIEGLSVPAAGAADQMSSRTGDQLSNASASSARDVPALTGVFAPREQTFDACERITRQMIAQRIPKVPKDHSCRCTPARTGRLERQCDCDRDETYHCRVDLPIHDRPPHPLREINGSGNPRPGGHCHHTNRLNHGLVHQTFAPVWPTSSVDRT